ncbi:hypothetical protein [Litchfieldia alkalitelluris]|nr:hypothetical protein [Litchfieldia alkalitelluris]
MDKQKLQSWIDRKLYQLSTVSESKDSEQERRIYIQLNSLIAEGKFDK